MVSVRSAQAGGDVLIVGGGQAGLAAALALGGKGFSVTVADGAGFLQKGLASARLRNAAHSSP